MTTKTATVLISDLVGSTELASQLGDAAASSIFRAHLASVRDLVARHGGHLVKFMGDGALAWFESAAAAVDCAAELPRFARREDRRLSAPLDMRVGLSAGEVILADDDVYGTPVVEASRLCALADVGQVLCAQIVTMLVGPQLRYPARVLEAVQLKGLPAPTIPVEIQWQSAGPATELPVALSRANRRGPCLDREEALEVLGRAADLVAGGDQRLVVVSGEPGIGKSRLVAAHAQRAAESDVTVGYGWCDPQLPSPYQPWVEVLDPLAAGLPPEALAVVDPGRDLGRILPSRAGPEDPARGPFGAEEVRQRLFSAVHRLIALVGERGPLLVVLDDAQWLDGASVALLRFLLRTGGGGPLLVVACTRTSGFGGDQPLAELMVEVSRDGRLDRIELGGVSRTAVGELVRVATADSAGGHWGGAAVADSLFDMTDGNPFLVNELLEHLRRTGTLFVGRRAASVPDGVRQLVGESLRQVPADLRPLVELAAVFGREVDLRTLVGLSGFDRAACAQALDAAIRAGLMTERDGGRVAFRHQLLREAVHDSLSGPVRAELHWRVGIALESGAAAGDLTQIAFHLCAGAASGEPVRAVTAALDAADAAAARAAVEVAHELVGEALAILERDGLDRDDLRARALVGQAEYSGVVLGGTAGVGPALVEASTLALRLGLTETMRRAALAFTMVASFGQVDAELAVVGHQALQVLDADDPARAGVLATLGMAQFLQGDVVAGEAAISEAVAVAERSGSPQARLLALNARATLGQQRADVEAFGRDVTAALEAAQQVGGGPWPGLIRMRMIIYCARIGDRAQLETEHRAFLAAGATPDYLAFARMLDGTLAMADGHLSEVEAAARGMLASLPGSSPFFDIVVAHLAHCLALQERYEESAEQLARIPARQPGVAAAVTMRRGHLAAALGDHDEARRCLESVLGLTDGLFDFYQGSVLHDLAQVVLALGEERAMPRLVERLEGFSGQLLLGGGLMAIWGPADDARGRLLARMGRVDEAVEAVRAALALCDGFSASALSVRCQRHLAELLDQRGGDGDAAAAVSLRREALVRSAGHEIHTDRRQIEADLAQTMPGR